MAKAQVIAVSTAKGGTGKTAISLQLAGQLARRERVVLVDLDVQADCTSGLGIRDTDPRNDHGASLLNALRDGTELTTVSTRREAPGHDGPVVFERERLRLVPGGEEMAKFLPWATAKSTPDNELSKALEPLRETAEWIILDCPPTDTWTQRQALCAADWLIVPVSDDHDELRGLKNIMKVVDGLAEKSRVKLLGVVLARMPASAKLAIQETREQALEMLQGTAPILSPVIRESVEFGRAKGLGLTVGEYGEWVTAVDGMTAARPTRGLAYDYSVLTDSVVAECTKHRT